MPRAESEGGSSRRARSWLGNRPIKGKFVKEVGQKAGGGSGSRKRRRGYGRKVSAARACLWEREASIWRKIIHMFGKLKGKRLIHLRGTEEIGDDFPGTGHGSERGNYEKVLLGSEPYGG